MEGRKSSGSIKSGFQFLNYKIDTIEFNTKTNSVMLKMDAVKIENFNPGLFIRDAYKYTEDDKTFYMGGIEAKVEISDNGNDLATGIFGIEGLFAVVDDCFNAEQEEMLVKTQIPSILFPYLRSAITNILASAGFGSIVFPLINIYNAVEKQEKREKIKIIPISENNE